MNSYKMIFAILFACIISGINASNKNITFANDEKSVQWNGIDDAVAKAKSSNKKFILIELYTSWCGWCTKMEETTYKNTDVINALNANFYIIKFDAETKSSVNFNGKNYDFNPSFSTKGANQLAIDLGKSGARLGYPTIIILDQNGNKIQSLPGYKDAETMKKLLDYFTTDSYKKVDFQQFQSK